MCDQKDDVKLDYEAYEKFSLEKHLQNLSTIKAHTNTCLLALQMDGMAFADITSKDVHDLRKLQNKLNARQAVLEDALEQLYSQKLTWLAEPLPLRRKLILRLKRMLKKRNANLTTKQLAKDIE